jgi:NTP pyrophosphatase (non-canonical NTP hydrolase)
MIPEIGSAYEEESLRAIQKQVGAWSRKNFGEQISKVTGQVLGSLNPLLGVQEECGELTHAVLKRHQGIRGFDKDETYIDARDDAVSDLLIYLCDFAEREGIDLQALLNKVWNKVKQRDWQKNKTNAHEEVQDLNSLENKLEKVKQTLEPK